MEEITRSAVFIELIKLLRIAKTQIRDNKEIPQQARTNWLSLLDESPARKETFSIIYGAISNPDETPNEFALRLLEISEEYSRINNALNPKIVELENAQKIHLENPETFYAPSVDELRAIKVDDFVKVCAGGERFWVIVEKVSDDIIHGEINNDLINFEEHGLSDCDKISLKLENVYQILKKEELKK